MTHDVNAAIRGAREGGATSIVIKDSHGNSKNLLIDELEPGVELVSGHGNGDDGMMQGVDASFDAAFLVGYHAKAGTRAAVMEHTITGGIHRLFVNGQETGEIGLSAGVAGHYGVPLVLITSDLAGCREAAALLPGVRTVPVKEGIGRYMARALHPSETGPAIEAAAREALQALAEKKGVRALPAGTEPGLIAQTEIVRSEGGLTLHRWEEPTEILVEFNRAEEADMGEKATGWERVDGYSIRATFPSYRLAHRGIWNLVALSFQGIGAQH